MIDALDEMIICSICKYAIVDITEGDLFLMENYEGEEIIRKGLEKKLNAMVDRELYSKFKRARTEVEREKSRQEYLERKGIPENFRW